MSELSHTGYYGKVPAKGDFLMRHLPRTFVDPWDRWLQQGIAASQKQLADNWLEVYMTSPIWHFALSKGLCSQQAWIGLVMPSVDNVGRYFPLTLAISMADNDNLLCFAQDQTEWFSTAQALALSALENDFEIDRFNAAIDGLQLQDPSGTSPPQNSANPLTAYNDSRWRIGVAPPTQLKRSLPFMLEGILNAHYSAYSFWWTEGSEHVQPSLLLSRHFPQAQSFVALLEGDWARWGWNDNDTIKTLTKQVDNESLVSQPAVSENTANKIPANLFDDDEKTADKIPGNALDGGGKVADHSAAKLLDGDEQTTAEKPASLLYDDEKETEEKPEKLPGDGDNSSQDGPK